MVDDVYGSADSPTAQTWVVTDQVAEYGHDGQSCSFLALDYDMVFDSGVEAWLTNGVSQREDPASRQATAGAPPGSAACLLTDPGDARHRGAMTAKGILTAAELDDALSGLPDWRHRNTGIYTAYRCADSATAVDLMGRIGAVCQELDHHPDLDWRYDHLFIDSSSHDAGGAVTKRDVRLARRISELADEAGATAVPAENRSYDLALDTRDPAALEDFWSTALGYRKNGRTGDLRDPQRRGPGFWFQQTDSPDPHPMHVDVTAPRDSWDPVRAALTERSRDQREDATFAPRWWIYTDADGNRVCLCSGEDDAEVTDAEG